MKNVLSILSKFFVCMFDVHMFKGLVEFEKFPENSNIFFVYECATSLKNLKHSTVGEFSRKIHVLRPQVVKISTCKEIKCEKIYTKNSINILRIKFILQGK